MKDIMHDLETYGVPDRLPPGVTPVIASIGAIRFDLSTGEFGQSFYCNVTRESCEAIGMQCDEDTLDWWSKQTQAAQDALLVDQIDIHEACSNFRTWVRGMRKGQYLWGNGVLFDNAIMRGAFRLADVRFPIHWSHDSDVRTLVRIGPKNAVKNEPQVGTHHNALDDSIYQANYCSKIYKRIKGYE